MRIGLLGDLHGKPELAERWIRLTEPDFCIQIGDYWCYDQAWSVPVYWMFGNHEDWDYVNAIICGNYELPTNSHWMMGGVEEIDGISVMALPGLPQSRSGPGPANFPPKVMDLCNTQVGQRVDILASHGCGFPFSDWVYDVSKKKSVMKNLEERKITDLISRVRPAYAVSGHNHRFAIEDHDGITCIRLGATTHKDAFAHIVEIDQ